MFTELRDLLGGPTGIIDPSIIPVTPNDEIAPDQGDSKSSPPPLPVTADAHPDESAGHILASRVQLLKTSVYHLPRLCHVGCVGSDVLAYKRALVKSGARPDGLDKSLTPRQRRTFGVRFRGNVERFQRNHGLQTDGVIGPGTLLAMTPYIDSYGAYMLHQESKWIAEHQATIDPHTQAVHHALRGAALAYLWHYAEIRPYPSWEPADHTPTTTDCSGGFGLWAMWGGMKSPFGAYLYSGYGNCVTPDTRILTRDLRWVPAGDLKPGSELWAFDADIQSGNGRAKARKFRRAIVLSSTLAMRECVRITLESGEELVCTLDHPWMTITKGNINYRWCEAQNLLRGPVGRPIDERRLIRPFAPWRHIDTWEAGWLAGMFDGEGWIQKRAHRGGRTGVVGVIQSVGETAARLIETSHRYGSFSGHRIIAKSPTHRDRIELTTNGGGTASAAEFLGSVRPERLIGKFDIDGAIMQAVDKPRVVSVEPVGLQEIQQLSTSTGTYFAEGFAVHNTDTMIANGTEVSSPAPGDAILYTNPGHVVMCVKWPYGVSFGSEAGPYYLDSRYRAIYTFRRF